MASFIHNAAKGKHSEFMARVNANDPTNSVLLLALIANTGVESDAVLLDKADWTALVSGTTDFATNTGAVRKTLDQTGGITVTIDNTNDRTDVDIPDQTWTAVANDGTGAIADIATTFASVPAAESES